MVASPNGHKKQMKYATFINFTTKPFTAHWNGKPYTFNPGDRKEHLNAGIAEHFAKHLANQVLTETGKERYTSPKKPLEVPEFMTVFNKAFFLEGDGSEVDSETGLPVDGRSRSNELGSTDQVGMNVRVAPRVPIDPFDARANSDTAMPEGKPQIIGGAIGNDDESTFEENQ